MLAPKCAARQRSGVVQYQKRTVRKRAEKLARFRRDAIDEMLLEVGRGGRRLDVPIARQACPLEVQAIDQGGEGKAGTVIIEFYELELLRRFGRQVQVPGAEEARFRMLAARDRRRDGGDGTLPLPPRRDVSKTPMKRSIAAMIGCGIA